MPVWIDGGSFTHPANGPTTMIKTTLKQLQDSIPSLDNLNNLDLPAKLSFKLAYVRAEANRLLAKHQPEWDAIMSQFGEKSSGVYVIPDDKREFADSAIERFMSKEVELPLLNGYIHVRELGMSLVKGADLGRLNWLFEGEL